MKICKRLGFTLIEIMVAVLVFSIIAVISYRIITSLVNTKEIVVQTQKKWGDLSLAMSSLGNSWVRVIPLVVRDQSGNVLPALYGKEKLDNSYDSQLELSISGYSGDEVFGTSPPKRVGYRFYNGSLYLVSWPVLNHVLTTHPEIDLLIDNVNNFEISYYYPDNQWRSTWPTVNSDPTLLPKAIKAVLSLNSGESVERYWTLYR